MRVAPSNEAQRARTPTLLSGELPPAVLPNPLRPRAWAAGPQRCRRDRGLHPLHLALAEPWSPCALLSWRPCRVRSPDELLHVDVSWRSGVLACKRCFQWLVGNVWTPVSHDEGAKRDARECASRSLWGQLTNGRDDRRRHRRRRGRRDHRRRRRHHHHRRSRRRHHRRHRRGAYVPLQC